MIKNIDKMGVLILMAHLVITLSMLGIYALFAYIGQPLTTIENMLLVIVGYWFGAMGKETIINKSHKELVEQNQEKGA